VGLENEKNERQAPIRQDNLNLLTLEDDLNFWKIEDNLIFIYMEEDLEKNASLTNSTAQATLPTQ
jgi:hypothetical protein